MKKITHSRSKQHIPNHDQKSKRIQNKYSGGNQPESNGYNPPPNQSNGTHPQNKVYQYPTAKSNYNGNSYHESRVHYRNHQDIPPFSRAKSREKQIKESIPLLKERLINLQQHYEQLIQEEKAKNIERSEVILGLLDEMQAIHKEKVASIKKAIQQSEQQNKDMGEVDGKMYEIKGNIDDLIAQSNALKTKNEKLQLKIESKGEVIRQKQTQLEEINKELLECRNEVEQFELSTLKNNKINREIAELFNSTNSFN